MGSYRSSIPRKLHGLPLYLLNGHGRLFLMVHLILFRHLQSYAQHFWNHYLKREPLPLVDFWSMCWGCINNQMRKLHILLYVVYIICEMLLSTRSRREETTIFLNWISWLCSPSKLWMSSVWNLRWLIYSCLDSWAKSWGEKMSRILGRMRRKDNGSHKREACDCRDHRYIVRFGFVLGASQTKGREKNKTEDRLGCVM